ncbi:hypothetical protein HY989_02820 [Candidatus Micrarchaeota archaeon]|nr:hypothetical protein [Candidatus Micrarchaeota archaeon]
MPIKITTKAKQKELKKESPHPFRWVWMAFGIIVIGIIIIVVGIMYFRGNQSSGSPCLEKLASLPICLSENGNWNSEAKNLLASEYGFDTNCLKPGGELDGSSWKADETHFNCGRMPIIQ